MPPATAQEAFRRMLNEHVSPALREEGFKGSAGTYTLPSDTHWIQLGFQRSFYSDASEVKFTLNCKVVRRDVWEDMRQQRPSIGDKPNPNIHAGAFEWWQRLGELTPARDDTWWSLRPQDDAARLAEEVVTAIRTYAVPAMQAQVAATT